MSEWLRPILGAALLLAGAAGIAYKVISGYQHASPDAFFSVQDRNKPGAAAPAADSTPQATTPPADVTAPAPSAAAPSPPTIAAPPTAAAAAPLPAAPGNILAVARSPSPSVDLRAEAQDNPECAAINAEQSEIQAALQRQYSPEQGRFMQRRLRELKERSVKFKCAE